MSVNLSAAYSKIICFCYSKKHTIIIQYLSLFRKSFKLFWAKDTKNSKSCKISDTTFIILPIIYKQKNVI